MPKTEPQIEIVEHSASAADPNDPRHPQWVKQTLTSDVAEWERSLGREVDVEAIEREWVETLEQMPTEIEHNYKADAQDNPAEADAAELGYEYRKVENPTDDTLAHRIGTNEKSRAMWIRIARLMAKSETGEYLFPRFAGEVTVESVRCQAGWRYYKGQTPTRRNEILNRRLEDICDRSTSVLGKWWT